MQSFTNTYNLHGRTNLQCQTQFHWCSRGSIYQTSLASGLVYAKCKRENIKRLYSAVEFVFFFFIIQLLIIWYPLKVMEVGGLADRFIAVLAIYVQNGHFVLFVVQNILRNGHSICQYFYPMELEKWVSNIYLAYFHLTFKMQCTNCIL